MCSQIKAMMRKQDPRILNEEMFMEGIGDTKRILGCESSVVVYHLSKIAYVKNLEVYL